MAAPAFPPEAPVLVGGFSWMIPYIGFDPDLVAGAGKMVADATIPPYEADDAFAAPIGPVAPIDPVRQTLAEYGPEMAAAEVHYGLPAGLIWAVAWRESTGGEFACGTYNSWGWQSCKYEPAFASHEDGIETVAARLAELIYMFGIEGALSVWVSGSPTDGLWYSAEVIDLLPAVPGVP